MPSSMADEVDPHPFLQFAILHIIYEPFMLQIELCCTGLHGTDPPRASFRLRSRVLDHLVPVSPSRAAVQFPTVRLTLHT
jgi:hypothetical protein